MSTDSQIAEKQAANSGWTWWMIPCFVSAGSFQWLLVWLRQAKINHSPWLLWTRAHCCKGANPWAAHLNSRDIYQQTKRWETLSINAFIFSLFSESPPVSLSISERGIKDTCRDMDYILLRKQPVGRALTEVSLLHAVIERHWNTVRLWMPPAVNEHHSSLFFCSMIRLVCICLLSKQWEAKALFLKWTFRKYLEIRSHIVQRCPFEHNRRLSLWDGFLLEIPGLIKSFYFFIIYL